METPPNAAVQVLIDDVKRAGNPYELIESVRRLIKVPAVEAIPTLRSVFDCNNAVAGRLAVDGLISIGDPAVQYLLDTIDEGNYGSRANSIRALTGIGNVDALPRLWKTSIIDQGPSIRRAAIKGLGTAKYEQFAVVEKREEALQKTLDLLRSLADDPDWAIRYSGVISMLSLHQSAAVTPEFRSELRASLQSVAATDLDRVVRLKAFTVLRTVGHPISSAHLDALAGMNQVEGEDDGLLYRWQPGQSDPDSADDGAALEDGACLPWEAGTQVTAAAVDKAVQAVSSDPDAGVRYYYAWWLGRFRATSAATALLHALANDQDSTVRRAACRSLGQIRPRDEEVLEAVRPVLVDALYGGDFHLREAAAATIGALRLHNATDALMELLQGRRQGAQAADEHALEHSESSGTQVADEALAMLLADGILSNDMDDDAHAHQGASHAAPEQSFQFDAGERGVYDFEKFDADVRDGFKDLFTRRYKDKAAKIKRGFYEGRNEPYEALVRSLAALEVQEAVPYVECLLDHPTGRVRYAAARSLYSLTRDTRYVNYLLAQLASEPDFKARRLIALNLAGLHLTDPDLMLKAASSVASTTTEPLFKIAAVYSLMQGAISHALRHQTHVPLLDSHLLSNMLASVDLVM